MRADFIIAKKRDGESLTGAEVRFFVRGVVTGEIPDVQAAAFLMAAYLRGMDAEETGALTDAMMRSGTVLDLGDIPGPKVDKHSTGGVGDKTSLVVAPVVAACGGAVPMISGRGLGHTGGTLDKLESIPGFRTDLSLGEIREQVASIGLVITGQTPELCPADRMLYAIRDVTATVASIPLIAASILSKKLAEGLDALVLDVKTGSGAFMRDIDGARALARALVEPARTLGVDARALVTDMSQPLGRAVGNALEVAEAVEALCGGGPEDLRTLCRELSAHMLLAAKLADDLPSARARHDAAIDDGSALSKLREMVARQGGDVAVLDEPAKLPRAPASAVVRAGRGGFLHAVDTTAVGAAAVALGAGRSRPEDRVDPSVGFTFRARIGDEVEEGGELARVHAATATAAERTADRLRPAFEIGEEEILTPVLVLTEIV